MGDKRCSKCGGGGPFRKDDTSAGGARSTCKECERRYSKERRRRVAGAADLSPPERARGMRSFKSAVRRSGGDLESVPQDDREFLEGVAERERRQVEDRTSRSVALASAHEFLWAQEFERAAQRHLRDKVVPVHYATRTPSFLPDNSVVAQFSDLHIGANLSPRENPWSYSTLEERRRLEKVMFEVVEYKSSLRNTQELVALLNGDLIEGMLLHDLRDGATLTEQASCFWHYFRIIIGTFAANFPSVRVVCQPGNHGRDKIRHPGRATSSKWDGHEGRLYRGLQLMCEPLKNVRFLFDRKPVSVVDIQGHSVLVAHGDTEPAMRDPDTATRRNLETMHRLNDLGTYGAKVVLGVFGHLHKGRYIYGSPSMIFNPALVPPNGWARSAGLDGEPCGQAVWHATRDYPVKDFNIVSVGPSDDRDENLGSVVTEPPGL